MKRIYEILMLAKNGIPQALSRFNDGEVSIMQNENAIAARGDQKGSVQLQASLIDAITFEKERYWKGYPCSVCFPKLHEFTRQWFNSDYEYNTIAVVNTNRNWEIFRNGMEEACVGKKIIWVSGEDQDLSMLNYDIIEHVSIPNKNSWRFYQIVLNRCLELVKPGYVFFFSCGPLARVLVKDLFEARDDASYFDIGSTYDPFTRNVWHKCHLGTLKKCKECN